MSWQSYVDTNLVGSGKLAKAAILGTDGSVWATSADFPLSASEVKSLMQSYTSPSDLFLKGIELGGKKVGALLT